jgi:hypothetical protein
MTHSFPLVRGGKIPPGALRWLTEVERVFPGATKDIILVRENPNSSSPRKDEIGNSNRARGTNNE